MTLTNCTVYPAPKALISHFLSSDANQKVRGSTYKPSPFPKIFGGTTTRFPRVHLDIEERFRFNVLDLVDPWP